MNVSTSQLGQIANVLDDLEEGRIDVPRVPGQIGQFLREFAQSRTDAETRLGVEVISQRSISGQELMPLELVPITPLEIRIQGPVIGSVTSAVAASETSATTLRVTLWGGAQGANRLLRIWRPNPKASVLLSGRYRWHAPSRITPGEAKIEVVNTDIEWHEIRCLKFTGDDMGQAPPAAMFHVDLLTEPYGIKAFRVVAIRRRDGRWSLVPALNRTAASVELVFPPAFPPTDADQLLALVWTQPWEPSRWHVVDIREVSGDDILAHNISWADHNLELRGHGRLEGGQIRALHQRLREDGIKELSIERAIRTAHMTRRLDPAVRAYAGWLRGT